ncbi:MAG: metallophosphoesterase [Candidatus Acidiferrum sp.]
MNWAWFLTRLAIGLSLLALLYLSQRFWYKSLWRVTANWGQTWLRVLARSLYLTALLLIIIAIADSLRMDHGRILPRGSMVAVFAGLWFTSAMFAYAAVKVVRGADHLFRWVRSIAYPKSTAGASEQSTSSAETVPDPSRRYFFRTATAVAGAAPFLGVMYGYAAERLRYQVRRIEIPIANLPSRLDGMQIVQLSDIHLSGYMSPESVRRAVDMANDLGADLAVVTGDLITGSHDSIHDCIEEIRHLRALLGVWGCNGNHEIYARAEDTAQILYAQAGMKLLRQENAQLVFKGATFNLLGVDYQRERTPTGRRMQMLSEIEPLVRRDMPNILLSHNPNSYNRAAELGIELSLAGHTHGGQVQVEILDHRLSPARFITDYIAGIYTHPMIREPRPVFPHREDIGASASAVSISDRLDGAPHTSSLLYVNRGIGTVGAPVRLGVPPEITLLVLRRA